MLIFRYLEKEVFANLLATTSVLLIILMLNQFVHYLNEAASGQITITAVAQVMLLQMPLLLGYLLPLGFLLGMMLAFGRLYVDSEMTVLGACGVSRGQLLKMALMLATLVALVVMVIMLWLEPKMQWYRMLVLQRAIVSASLAKMLPAQFQSIGSDDRWTFYAQSAGHHHQIMHQIFLAKHDAYKVCDGKHHRWCRPWDIMTADQAYQKQDAKTRDTFLVFQNGYRTIGAPGYHHYRIIHYRQYAVRLLSEKLDLSSDAVKYQSSAKLWKNYRQDRHAAVELKWRLAMPISVWLFALIAVPLSYTKPRRGRYFKLLPAILIYILYANLLFINRAWLEQGLVAMRWGFWWLHAIILIVGLLLSWHFLYGDRFSTLSWIKRRFSWMKGR